MFIVQGDKRYNIEIQKDDKHSSELLLSFVDMFKDKDIEIDSSLPSIHRYVHFLSKKKIFLEDPYTEMSIAIFFQDQEYEREVAKQIIHYFDEEKIINLPVDIQNKLSDMNYLPSFLFASKIINKEYLQASLNQEISDRKILKWLLIMLNMNIRKIETKKYTYTFDYFYPDDSSSSDGYTSSSSVDSDSDFEEDMKKLQKITERRLIRRKRKGETITIEDYFEEFFLGSDSSSSSDDEQEEYKQEQYGETTIFRGSWKCIFIDVEKYILSISSKDGKEYIRYQWIINKKNKQIVISTIFYKNDLFELTVTSD